MSDSQLPEDGGPVDAEGIDPDLVTEESRPIPPDDDSDEEEDDDIDLSDLP